MSKYQAELVVFVYSSEKDGRMFDRDLWQIFKPMHMKGVEEINCSREKR